MVRISRLLYGIRDVGIRGYIVVSVREVEYGFG